MTRDSATMMVPNRFATKGAKSTLIAMILTLMAMQNACSVNMLQASVKKSVNVHTLAIGTRTAPLAGHARALGTTNSFACPEFSSAAYDNCHLLSIT